VDLADTLVEDFDIIDFLHTLVGRCVRLLDVEAAGIMLAGERGRLHPAAASAEDARLFELLEFQAGAGPCADCCRTGIAVVNADPDSGPEGRPGGTGTAWAGGFATVSALPLRLRETVVGALVLFCAEGRALPEEHVRTAQAMADFATVGILAQRSVHQSGLLAAQLEHALASRRVMDQAKTVLAGRRRITVDTAFALLRDYARRNDRRLSDVARDVVGGSWTVPDQPWHPRRRP
jgi:GAF domain-containing protein